MIRRKALYFMLSFAALGGCAGYAPPPRPVVYAAPPPTAVPAPAPTQGPTAREHSEALMQTLSALGTRYDYGGASYANGFDCSGLVAHVFLEAYGIRLPHSARAQSRLGTPVSLADLRPGDLVFFDTEHRRFSHVGIYIGHGQFVHAPRTGEKVRVSDLHKRYWMRRFDGARRIEPLRDAER